MDLPEEVLIKIFEYVLCNDSLYGLHKSVLDVNKEWRAAALSSYILRKIDSSISKPKLIKLATEGYLKCTEELDLRIIGESLKGKDFETIFENTPCLKSLNLRNSPRDGESLTHLVHNCHDLEALYLAYYYKDPSEKVLKENSLNEILKACGTKMKILNLSFNDLSRFLTIKNLPHMCPNLEELDLLSYEDSNIIFPLENFQKLCPKLKILRLGPNVIFERPKGDAPGFKELEYFKQSHGAYREICLNDYDLNCLLGKSKKLKSLDISGNRRITAENLCNLPARNIETLYVSQTCFCGRKSRSEGLEQVVDNWRHSLKDLDISKTKSESVNIILADFEKYGAPNLQTLDIHYTNVDCIHLLGLLRSCKSLEVLYLGFCKNLEWVTKHLYKGRKELESLLKTIDINLNSFL